MGKKNWRAADYARHFKEHFASSPVVLVSSLLEHYKILLAMRPMRDLKIQAELISHKKIFDARRRVRRSEIRKRNEKVKDGSDSLYFDSETLEMKEIKGVTSCSQLQQGDVYAVCHDEKFITNVAGRECGVPNPLEADL